MWQWTLNALKFGVSRDSYVYYVYYVYMGQVPEIKLMYVCMYVVTKNFTYTYVYLSHSTHSLRTF